MTIDAKFKGAELFYGRCPTCTQNMLKSICAVTCSPEQDRFISVSTMTEDSECATSVDFRLDPEYMSKTFDSCKGVNSPLSGGLVIENACDDGNSFTCTPKKWYKYMGNYDAFKISYVSESDREKRFEYPAKRCNESYDNSYACSCVDCQMTCDRADIPRGEIKGQYMRRTTYILLVIVTFTCIIPGILFFMSKSTVGTSKGIVSVDAFPRKFFAKWGEKVATYPITVLLLFGVLVMSLGLGTMFLNMTTDPVKLWAASSSQARQEKKYFDATFGPFYRIEQLFLQPTFQGNVRRFC